jgi:hypothetical protein
MSEESSKGVPLRLLVSEEFKSRLKAQAGRMGKTMGELVELIAGEPLRKLELETIKKSQQEQPTTFKEFVEVRGGALLKQGGIDPKRIQAFTHGTKPSSRERQIIAQMLDMPLEELPD